MLIPGKIKTKLVLIFFLLALKLNAQETIPELVTDKPDQTESSGVVPHKALQLETGFVLENDETNFINQKKIAWNTTLLRYGLCKNLELRLGMEYLAEKMKMKYGDSTVSISGFSPVMRDLKLRLQMTKDGGPK
jgi:hypothetical protein